MTEIDQNREQYLAEQRQLDRLFCLIIFCVLALLALWAARERFQHDDLFTRNTPPPTAEQTRATYQ